MHNTLTSFWGRPATHGSVQDISEHKRLESRLHALSGRLLKVLEEERRRVARELHDGICQTLTASRLALEVHLMRTPEVERRASMQRLRDSVRILRETEDEVRRISTDLRPVMLDDLGLLATMRWHLGELNKRHPDLEVHDYFGVAEPEIPEHLKTPIFRITQEAASNAVRHGGASTLNVYLRADRGLLRLKIKDDGVGFDKGTQQVRVHSDGHHGLGLSSMAERVKLTGGIFRVSSTPGQGTKVEAHWRLGGSALSE
jgi:signal transduction histidine kinase